MAAFLYTHTRLLILLIAIICVAGLSALNVMPRMEDPVLTSRFGIVRTIFPGANAERIESQITKPIEDEVAGINGIKSVTSTSSPSVSVLTVELENGVADAEEIWAKVRDALSEKAKDLPEGAYLPKLDIPNMRSFAVIVGLKWIDDESPTDFQILQRQANLLEERMRSVFGTEAVTQFGSRDQEILIQVPQEVGVSIGDLASQLNKNETIGVAGKFRGETADLAVELSRGFDSIEEIRATPIKLGAQQQMMRLDELATITETTSDPPESIAIIDNRDAIVIGATIKKDERIDTWTADLNADLESFKESVPEQIELDVVFTQNEYVEDRLQNLGVNLFIGTAAVVLIVFFMMGWQSMLVVGITLPLSAMIVLFGMNVMGIPIHQMSITGLIIALGLLIDNAIVIIDEVSAKLREGESRLQAIKTTIYQLRLPLFGSTLTTTLSFLPIALLPGSSGEFVGPMAISVILAINASFFLAMTVVPALTILFRGKPKSDKEPKGLAYFFRYGMYNQWIADLYRSLLVGFFRRPILGVIVGLALPIVGFYLHKKLPKQFFPPSERDQVHIQLEMAATSSINKTEATCRAVTESVKAFTDFERLDWFVGQSAPSFYYNMVAIRQNSPNYAQAYLEFPEGVANHDLVHDLQQHLDADFPGARILVRELEQGPPVISPIKIELFGPDLDKLWALGDEIRLIMSQTPDIVHTKADLSERIPTLNFEVDEEKVTKGGLSRQAIEQQLYASLEGVQVGSLLDGNRQVPIQVRLADETRNDTEKISELPIQHPYIPGGPPPKVSSLSELGELTLISKIAKVSHIERQRVNVIRGYVTPGVLPSVVEKDLRKKVDELIAGNLPDGYRIDWGGEPEKRKRAVKHLQTHMPLLLTLMIVTLVASFRSFRIAAIIAMVGALSIGLGLGSLWLFQYPFGFMGVVGAMGLLGIAVNDAIVVMAGIHHDGRAKMGDPVAVADVIFRRTRHIIATTITTVAGFLPLIMDGGDFWPPVATTIAGGVCGATVLALCFVPCVYLLFKPRRKKRLQEEERNQSATQKIDPQVLQSSAKAAAAMPASLAFVNPDRQKRLAVRAAHPKPIYPSGCLLVIGGEGVGTVLPLEEGITELVWKDGNAREGAEEAVFTVECYRDERCFEITPSGKASMYLNGNVAINHQIVVVPNTILRVDSISLLVIDFFSLEPSPELVTGNRLRHEERPAQLTDPNDYAVGCVVIVDGPGKGEMIPIGSQYSSIGSGEHNQISLNYGDANIGPDNVLQLAFVSDQNQFYANPGSNGSVGYINSSIAVLEPVSLNSGDFITIGETTMMLFPFCTDGWNWQTN